MHQSYLEAKREIDDRSLNRQVWDAVFLDPDHRDRPLRIAEIGAGTGTMVERLRAWGGFDRLQENFPEIHYHAWEINPDTAAVLEKRLVAAPEIAEHRVFQTDARTTVVERGYDLLIAHAVLDLFTPTQAVLLAERLVRPGGQLYASIVFDGETLLEPDIDPVLDREILERYHRSMSGGFGRRQMHAFHRSGWTLQATGGSDWVVPPRSGGPLEAEREVVSTVLDMMEESVIKTEAAHPCSAPFAGGVALADAPHSASPAAVREWIQRRRDQLTAGDLLFIAHQLDFLVRR